MFILEYSAQTWAKSFYSCRCFPPIISSRSADWVVRIDEWQFVRTGSVHLGRFAVSHICQLIFSISRGEKPEIYIKTIQKASFDFFVTISRGRRSHSVHNNPSGREWYNQTESGLAAIFTFSRLRERQHRGRKENKKKQLWNNQHTGFYVSRRVAKMSTKAEQCKYSRVFNVCVYVWCMETGDLKQACGELSLVVKPRLPKQVQHVPPHCRGWLEVCVRTHSPRIPLWAFSICRTRKYCPDLQLFHCNSFIFWLTCP